MASLLLSNVERQIKTGVHNHTKHNHHQSKCNGNDSGNGNINVNVNGSVTSKSSDTSDGMIMTTATARSTALSKRKKNTNKTFRKQNKQLQANTNIHTRTNTIHSHHHDVMEIDNLKRLLYHHRHEYNNLFKAVSLSSLSISMMSMSYQQPVGLTSFHAATTASAASNINTTASNTTTGIHSHPRSEHANSSQDVSGIEPHPNDWATSTDTDTDIDIATESKTQTQTADDTENDTISNQTKNQSIDIPHELSNLSRLVAYDIIALSVHTKLPITLIKRQYLRLKRRRQVHDRLQQNKNGNEDGAVTASTSTSKSVCNNKNTDDITQTDVNTDNSCDQQRNPRRNPRRRPRITTTSCLSGKACGLPNYGQTCFLNAVLQSLASITTFIRYLERIVYIHEHEHEIQEHEKNLQFLSNAMNRNRNSNQEHHDDRGSGSGSNNTCSEHQKPQENQPSSAITSSSSSKLHQFLSSSFTSIASTSSSFLSSSFISISSSSSSSGSNLNENVLLSLLLLQILYYINGTTLPLSSSSSSSFIPTTTTTNININEKIKLLFQKVASQNTQFASSSSKHRNSNNNNHHNNTTMNVNEQQDAQELLQALIAIVIQEGGLENDDDPNNNNKKNDDNNNDGEGTSRCRSSDNNSNHNSGGKGGGDDNYMVINNEKDGNDESNSNYGNGYTHENGNGNERHRHENSDDDSNIRKNGIQTEKEKKGGQTYANGCEKSFYSCHESLGSSSLFSIEDLYEHTTAPTTKNSSKNIVNTVDECYTSIGTSNEVDNNVVVDDDDDDNDKSNDEEGILIINGISSQELTMNNSSSNANDIDIDIEHNNVTQPISNSMLSSSDTLSSSSSSSQGEEKKNEKDYTRSSSSSSTSTTKRKNQHPQHQTSSNNHDTTTKQHQKQPIYNKPNIQNCKLSTSVQMMIQSISTKTPSPLSGCIGSTVQCCVCKHISPVQETTFLEIPIVPVSVSSAYKHYNLEDSSSSSSSAQNNHTPTMTQPSSTFTSDTMSSNSCSLYQCLVDFTSVERVHEVNCHACSIKEELHRLDEKVFELRNAIGSIVKKLQKRANDNRHCYSNGHRANGHASSATDTVAGRKEEYNQDQEALALLRRNLDVIEERVRFLSCADPDALEEVEDEEQDISKNSLSLDDHGDDDDDDSYGFNMFEDDDIDINNDDMLLEIMTMKMNHDPNQNSQRRKRQRQIPKPRRVDANKRLFLTRLPPVLCLHVKRLYFDPYKGRMVKSMEHIDFPEYLDVSSFCERNVMLKGHNRGANTNGQKISYRLMSVIEHRGNQFTGHYLSYRRVVDASQDTATSLDNVDSQENSWVVVSDEKVAFISWEHVRKCQACMLMYEAI